MDSRIFSAVVTVGVMCESGTGHAASSRVSSYDEVKEQYVGVYMEPEVTTVYELGTGNHRMGLLKMGWDATRREPWSSSVLYRMKNKNGALAMLAALARLERMDPRTLPMIFQ